MVQDGFVDELQRAVGAGGEQAVAQQSLGQPAWCAVARGAGVEQGQAIVVLAEADQPP